MKSFMLRTALFVLPFMALYVLNFLAYDQNEGDLTRLGFLYHDPSPKSMIAAPYSLSKTYTLLSSLGPNKRAEFDVLTIGDSFSEQDSLGYQNFMAQQGVSVLHLDRRLSGANPIQRLVEIVNGGFFDHIQVGCVVLQSAERKFVQRCDSIDLALSIGMDPLFGIMASTRKEKPKGQVRFFSDATVRIPWTNVEYMYCDKPEYSKTYKVATSNNELFTNGSNELLFYEDDIRALKYKHDSIKVSNCNRNLGIISEVLAAKKIKLIVLVCPDKYDLYYPYIVEKGGLEEPRFYGYFNSLPKTYKYLNVFDSLSVKLPVVKDVYYYDDTHWSPGTAKWVGEALAKMVKSE